MQLVRFLVALIAVIYLPCSFATVIDFELTGSVKTNSAREYGLNNELISEDVTTTGLDVDFFNSSFFVDFFSAENLSRTFYESDILPDGSKHWSTSFALARPPESTPFTLDINKIEQFTDEDSEFIDSEVSFRGSSRIDAAGNRVFNEAVQFAFQISKQKDWVVNNVHHTYFETYWFSTYFQLPPPPSLDEMTRFDSDIAVQLLNDSEGTIVGFTELYHTSYYQFDTSTLSVVSNSTRSERIDGYGTFQVIDVPEPSYIFMLGITLMLMFRKALLKR